MASKVHFRSVMSTRKLAGLDQFTVFLGRALSILPVLLAVLPIILAIPSFADAEMHRVGNSTEITGGSGAHAWRLILGDTVEAYISSPHATMPGQLLVLSGTGRAWLSNGGWLRLIDTESGIVLHRWHLTGVVTAIVPNKNSALVTVTCQQCTPRSYEVGLKRPDPPFEIDDRLILLRASRNEASLPPEFSLSQARLSGDQARRLLPLAEDEARRDPDQPWRHLAVGVILAATGNDGAAQAEYKRAVEVAAGDFTELLRMSAWLTDHEQPQLGDAAFESGYGDYLARGYEPRMLSVLIGELNLFPRNTSGHEINDSEKAHRREQIYRFGGDMEDAHIAWQLLADQLDRVANHEAAQLWRERSRSAYGLSAFSDFAIETDRGLIVFLGLLFAAVLFGIVQFIRYLPQRQFDKRNSRIALKLRAARLIGLYWSPRERYAFLAFFAGLWIVVGYQGQVDAALARQADLPIAIAVGSFGNELSIRTLSREMATPERDLMLAIAYQQAGETKRAELLYRKLPQFPESWNNLGLLVAERDPRAAHQYFEKALALNPSLAEAKLNLGQPGDSFWTRQFASELPGRKMMAPPITAYWERSLLGVSWPVLWLRALAGPLAVQTPTPFLKWSLSQPGFRLAFAAAACLLCLAVLLVFVMPQIEVTQAPGKRFWIWELICPGTARAWHWFSPIVMAVWCSCLVALFICVKQSSPYLLTSETLPSISRAFLVDTTNKQAMPIVGPSSGMILGFVILLFILNAALVGWAIQREQKNLDSSGSPSVVTTAGGPSSSHSGMMSRS